MICSSVKRLRLIVRPQVATHSNRRWRKNPVAGQIHRNYDRWERNLERKVRELTDVSKKATDCQITAESPHLA